MCITPLNGSDRASPRAGRSLAEHNGHHAAVTSRDRATHECIVHGGYTIKSLFFQVRQRAVLLMHSMLQKEPYAPRGWDVLSLPTISKLTTKTFQAVCVYRQT